jgi:hypothetical protein
MPKTEAQIELAAREMKEVERRLLEEQRRRELLSRGPEDLIYFAGRALKLRPKIGPLEPFIFNAAQNKLHEVIEEQKRKTGRVRVIVLKARIVPVPVEIGVAGAIG